MKYNEIERLQQLAGIITEIKVNNPNIKRIDAEIILDEDDDKIIKYSDIDVGASINNKKYASSSFDMNNEDSINSYNKLINLIKKNKIHNYNDEGVGDIRWVELPLEYINFI